MTYQFILNLIFAVFAISCIHNKPSDKTSIASQAQMTLYKLDAPVNWGPMGTQILKAGGFSGLAFLGKTKEGELQFISHTDRGPNAEPNLKKVRPFLQPGFQPRWVKLETDTPNLRLVIKEEILLTDSKGRPLSGRPQPGDEVPVDAQGKTLAYDLMGIDAESIAIDNDGNIWMGEEYRPSILKFNPKGHLLRRFIPRNSLAKKDLFELQKKYGKDVVVEALPEDFRHRKINRGFEGLAYRDGRIYAIVQSPLEMEADQKANTSRLVVMDVKTEKAVFEYNYPFTKDGVDKIGDLSFRPETKDLCLIEQNGKTGPKSTHRINCFVLPEDEEKNLKPTTLLELTNVGFDFAEKVEGLAFMDKNTFAVVNDNDFGVNGEQESVLGVFKLLAK